MRRSSLFVTGLVALVTLIVAMTAAPAAIAQVVGLYYQEVEKDGRVYVFNTPEKYKLFQESGDMGIAITLPGAGVDGITVVAENETAADLYFFKHNLPGYERPTPNTALPFTVSWKDGKTTIESKQARLDLSNRMQIRFTQEMPETGDDVGSFRMRRMKTKFEGWVYTKDLTYELQLNWPDTANPLEDASINYDLTKGKKTFQLKGGQFKVPFGRQELTSSGSQEFVDRSFVSNEFARSRDIGVQLWGTPMQGKLDWRVGIFNGNGRTVTRNDNDQYQTNARVTFQPFGDVKYSEGDFESTDRPLFAIAGQYENNERPVAAAGTTPADTAEREIFGGDVVFKYKGLFAFLEYFDATTDRQRQSDFDSDGYNVQVGYFIIPQKFEVAGRLAVHDPNADRDNDEREERGVALGYFFNKHPHKLQADYRQLETKTGPGTDVTNDEFRLQYQIIF
ncbi:MAG TPA: porin [Thermoanaerobaculia bacterium]|nr:porin [Thermoanaerobaculia bacterium]